MNFIEEAKAIFDRAEREPMRAIEIGFEMYSKKEGKMVHVTTVAEFEAHSKVGINAKLKDLFTELK